MKYLFQKISNLAEANKVIKGATLLLLILVGLQLLADLPTSNQTLIWKNLIWDSVEICLISLLRWYRKTTFCFLLILMFLFTILIHLQSLLSSSGGILTILQYLFYVFVCIRAWKATRIVQGESAIISHFTSNWYRWYFLVFFATMVAVYIDIFVNNRATTFDYFDLPISLIGVFGLFGHSFKKQIANATVWKIYLLVIVFWDIIGFFIYPQQHFTVETSTTAKIVSTGFMFCFLLPYYIAIYLYGYKSKSIWQRTHNQTLNAKSGNSPAAG